MNRPDFFDLLDNAPVTTTNDRKVTPEREAFPVSTDEAEERVRERVKQLQSAIFECSAHGSEPHLEIYTEETGAEIPQIIIKITGFTRRD